MPEDTIPWTAVAPWLALAIVCALLGGIRVRRAHGRARLLYAGLLLVGVWFSPVVQLPLYQRANHAFFEQARGYLGKPLPELAAALGPPRRVSATGSGFTTWRYEASPWFAPLGFSAVSVSSQDGERVEYVYYDAD